ncbi:hypothetical protein PUN28_006426 [Cardiocondyla obscurior]|uniref:Uncharacterized protein n=1 Tax=Cardiocondyla obscurior TaxID=286306 RepID=A0AAW2GAP3_9HYME
MEIISGAASLKRSHTHARPRCLDQFALVLCPITGSCVRGARSRAPCSRVLAFFRPDSSERYRALLAARKSDSIGSIAHYGSKHLSKFYIIQKYLKRFKRLI